MKFHTLHDGTNEKSLADWGFGQDSTQGTEVTRASSTWQGTVVTANVADAPVFTFEQQIKIYSTRDSDTGGPNSFSGGHCDFVGYRVGNPLKAAASGQGAIYRFENAWYLLKNTNYLQTYSSSATEFTPVSEIVLFQGFDNAGVFGARTPGQQIADILNHFLAQWTAQFPTKAVPFQVGAIDSSLSIFLPPYICRPLMCADAILKCLESFVRTNICFDYTTTPPTINVVQVDTAAAVSLALFDGTNHKSLSILQREDLVTRAVAVTYRITNSVNGSSTVGYAYDYWGPVMQAAFVAWLGWHPGDYTGANAAAQAVSPIVQYQSAFTAWQTAHGSQPGNLGFAVAMAAVNAAVAAGTCDPFSGLRVPGQMIDLQGFTNQVVSGFMDLELLRCSGGTQASKRSWWSSGRGGEVSALGDSRVRFQKLGTDVNGKNPVDKGYINTWVLATIPDATLYYSGAGYDGNGHDSYGNAVAADVNGRYPFSNADKARFQYRFVRGTYHSWFKQGNTNILAVKCRAVSAMTYSEYGSTSVAGTPDLDTTGYVITCKVSSDESVDLELTNAVPDSGTSGYATFETLSSSSSGEQYILGYGGIAWYLFNALQVPQYEGEYVRVKAEFGDVSIANRLNLTNGKDEWDSMNAQIVSIQRDYGSNTMSIQTGPEKHLSAQQLSSFLNMWRYRRTWFNTAVQNDNSQGGGNVAMPKTVAGANTTKGLNTDAVKAFFDYVTEPDGSTPGVPNSMVYDSAPQVTAAFGL